MMKMPLLLVLLLIGIATLLAPDLPSASALNVRGPLLKSQTFLSPPIFLLPGSVSNKYYLDIPFPRGHLALKSFNAEVVDERGAPVPLHETYLHHWIVEPYYAPAGSSTDAAAKNGSSEPPNKAVMARNSGVCTNALGQYYGLGSETRRTATWVPDPYGIEIGNPPAGYDLLALILTCTYFSICMYVMP
ncbi:hypothetical protein BS78_07G208100 [Paspalum vaginatum]|nr:hypothetical protein BS78_07G208100 [Paspalum vaginatum]